MVTTCPATAKLVLGTPAITATEAMKTVRGRSCAAPTSDFFRVTADHSQTSIVCFLKVPGDAVQPIPGFPERRQPGTAIKFSRQIASLLQSETVVRFIGRWPNLRQTLTREANTMQSGN